MAVGTGFGWWARKEEGWFPQNAAICLIAFTFSEENDPLPLTFPASEHLELGSRDSPSIWLPALGGGRISGVGGPSVLLHCVASWDSQVLCLLVLPPDPQPHLLLPPSPLSRAQSASSHRPLRVFRVQENICIGTRLGS